MKLTAKLSNDNPHLVGLYADSAKSGIGIELVNGKRFLILDPDPDVIDELVIAHAISQLCRFTGHCSPFYSVAQHCVMVSRIVPPELALQGLMHDASEAFIGDLSRPLKALLDELSPGLISGIEEAIHEVIAERFGFSYPHDPRVKDADNIALATEKRDIMKESTTPWFNMPNPLPEPIRALGPVGAKTQWLTRYEQLKEV